MEIYHKFRLGPLFIYITSFALRKMKKKDRVWKQHRKRLKKWKLKECEGKCEICGRKFHKDKMELHHVIPVSERPRLVLSKKNLMLLCHECHVKIHRKGGG